MIFGFTNSLREGYNSEFARKLDFGSEIFPRFGV